MNININKGSWKVTNAGLLLVGIQLMFLFFKLSGQLDWSWLWVWSPILLACTPVVLGVAVLILMAMAMFVTLVWRFCTGGNNER